MKQFVPLLIMSIIAALVLAGCGVGGTPTPTATAPGPAASGPTATPTAAAPGPGTIAPTETPTRPPTPSTTRGPTDAAKPTPTPGVVKEWELKGTSVDGGAVSVTLDVFAGIDVRVTLDGAAADGVMAAAPQLVFTFVDVGPGRHLVVVSDVVGFTEERVVVVPQASVDVALPDRLKGLIAELEGEAPANPPFSITRYEYRGQTVYYQTPACCDLFSNLYDSEGNLITHPDGGITGEGDGRAPLFSALRKMPLLVWQDARLEAPPETEQVSAPVDDVSLEVAESFPPQYFLRVVSGLPNSCHSFGGYTVTRDGSTVVVRVYNHRPTDEGLLCAQVYGMVETRVALGSDYDPESVYTVDVNGRKVSFQSGAVVE